MLGNILGNMHVEMLGNMLLLPKMLVNMLSNILGNMHFNLLGNMHVIMLGIMLGNILVIY